MKIENESRIRLFSETGGSNISAMGIEMSPNFGMQEVGSKKCNVAAAISNNKFSYRRDSAGCACRSPQPKSVI